MDIESLPFDRWKYFVEIGLWPKRASFDPRGWIENFTNDERPTALRLLDGFTFFSAELVQQMFRSAFLNLSQHVIAKRSGYLSIKEEWTRYVNSVVVVRVTGEIPNDSDSGYLFSRYARDVLQIREQQIMSPEQALACLMQTPTGSVLFVDDFVGSGNQFIETWRRQYKVSGSHVSFEMLSRSARAKVHFAYCPVLCTEGGRDNINLHCPSVLISPAHFLSRRQSALENDSYIWRDDMRIEGPEFVRQVSARAGIPDLGGQVGCWRGFQKLGLAVAFAHACPDATLPLFYHQANGWKPLLMKGAL